MDRTDQHWVFGQSYQSVFLVKMYRAQTSELNCSADPSCTDTATAQSINAALAIFNTFFLWFVHKIEGSPRVLCLEESGCFPSGRRLILAMIHSTSIPTSSPDSELSLLIHWVSIDLQSAWSGGLSCVVSKKKTLGPSSQMGFKLLGIDSKRLSSTSKASQVDSQQDFCHATWLFVQLPGLQQFQFAKFFR